MNRKIRFLAVVLCALFLCSCNKGHDEIISGPYTPAISSSVKIRVTDVWNDTHRVFDVDVIGLLWSGLEASLKKRGMLWSPEMGDHYLTLEAHMSITRRAAWPRVYCRGPATRSSRFSAL